MLENQQTIGNLDCWAACRVCNLMSPTDNLTSIMIFTNENLDSKYFWFLGVKQMRFQDINQQIDHDFLSVSICVQHTFCPYLEPLWSHSSVMADTLIRRYGVRQNGSDVTDKFPDSTSTSVLCWKSTYLLPFKSYWAFLLTFIFGRILLFEANLGNLTAPLSYYFLAYCTFC